jgi:hypothetical protein
LQVEDFALPPNTEHWMIRVDNFSPSLAAQILAKACSKKILLHCELTDLSMKLLDPDFIALPGLPGLTGKTGRNLFLDLLLPPRNLIGMHAVLAGKFGQSVVPGQGIQGDAGLELGRELPF